MSLTKANRMITSLIKRSDGELAEKYQLLLKLINNSSHLEITKEELFKNTGFKLNFIKNILEIIADKHDENSDFVLYKTKHGTYSMMRVANIRSNWLKRDFSPQQVNSESGLEKKQVANLLAMIKYWKNRAKMAERRTS